MDHETHWDARIGPQFLQVYKITMKRISNSFKTHRTSTNKELGSSASKPWSSVFFSPNSQPIYFQKNVKHRYSGNWYFTDYEKLEFSYNIKFRFYFYLLCALSMKYNNYIIGCTGSKLCINGNVFFC